MKICPWGGLPCDCRAFPFLKNGLVPSMCEEEMPPEILGLRKVSENGKLRHRAYLAEMEHNRKKNAQKENAA